jgi:hypothetical protein
MRTLNEAREEFNSRMNSYFALIIETDRGYFSDESFLRSKLNLPAKRLSYIPPAWAGAEFSAEFVASYRKNSPEKTREEIIPENIEQGNYLICDDFVNDGETFEIAFVRLVEGGIKLENIWAVSARGTSRQTGIALLDTAKKWHEYFISRTSLNRKILETLGLNLPRLDKIGKL